MDNWYLQSGKNSDVVKNVRISLRRNLSNINFLPKMKKEDYQNVISEFEKILSGLGYDLKFIRREEKR